MASIRYLKTLTLLFCVTSLFMLASCDLGNQDGGDSRSRQAVDVRVTPTETAREAPSYTPALTPQALIYLGWELGDTTDSPKACFNFLTPLRDTDAVSYRDYIRVEPEASYSVDVDGQNLCLSGFEFASIYAVTLRAGLQGANDLSLANDVKETIGFSDKPAFVRFAGEGVILPKANAQGLAIETVNVSRISVEIARVSDRMVPRREPQSGQATPEGDYSWEYQDAATDVRSVIWTGDIDIAAVQNKTITTIIPIADVIEDMSPGAYVVTVERSHDEDEDRIARAWRWIIMTDLALTSYRGNGGLDVSVRSIETAKLQPEIEVVLVARNNDILARSKTNINGHAQFSAALLNGTGSQAPHMLMAYGPDEDYAVLDLSRAPLDLSEQNISGRSVQTAIDLYGFSERGVYRPGETAHFTLMLRDLGAKAVTDRPVELVVKRPNGIEMLRERITERDLKASLGTLTWAYELPDSAQRGRWSLSVEADGIGYVGRVDFSVEDFVPQKLAVEIDVDDSPMTGNDVRGVEIDAQFLYGAPGAALDAESEARIRIDPNPFAEYSDYSFGLAQQSFRERLIDMGQGRTDDRGFLTLALDLSDEDIDSTTPLRADITAGVSEPGGRYVRNSVRIPVRTEPIYIGLKPGFEGSRAPRNAPVSFEIVALDRLGTQSETDVDWVLIEEDWDYNWYRENGRWRYRRDVRDLPLSQGALSLSATNSIVWSETLSWGDYRLEMRDNNKILSSYRFSVGWGQAQDGDRPDQIRIGSDTGAVAVGDVVSLSINAPYAGEGELVIANDKVRMVQPVTLSAGASNIDFKFAPEWGDSVYALLTLYTPRNKESLPVPRRAVGVHYIERDRTNQTLSIKLNTPERIYPRSDYVLSVNVDNIPSGETAWINVAAVDEGILRLTKYDTPDAASYFFGRKALGVDIRDDYGRILNANLGTPAQIRTGGDSLGGEGLSVVPTKTVSLFAGPVKLNNGKADITFVMPDFNGELRVMATAWSQSAVGSAATSMKVRDDVPAIVALPRFLAPGDSAFATVSLDNVDGQAGTYSAQLSGSSGLTLGDSMDFDLGSGQRLDQRTSITAKSEGITTVTANITGPGVYAVTSDYPLQVRSAFLPLTRVEYTQMTPSGTLVLDQSVTGGLRAETAEVTVSFSRLAGLNPTPIVESLSRYPYGCTEQTVSTALPLLYAQELGRATTEGTKEERRSIQKAVLRISGRQSPDGAFGLWSEGDRNATPWIGVYTTDFLFRAKDKGYYVSEDVLSRAQKALQTLSRLPRYPNLQYQFNVYERDREIIKAEAAAYAHYVLSQQGSGRLGDMRYLYDNHQDKFRSPLAFAHLSGALFAMGDEARARKAMQNSIARLGFDETHDYYQTELRDLAGVVAVASASGQSEIASTLLQDLSADVKDAEYLNTQEKAHLILAMAEISSSDDVPSVSVSKGSLSRAGNRIMMTVSNTDLSETISFTSEDDRSFWATVTVSGTPIEAPEARFDGFNISKQLYRLDGTSFEASEIAQGERLIVSLAFNSKINRSRSAIIADLLPAGFEIETVLSPEDTQSSTPFTWLGAISSFDLTEARDDRFIAAVETNQRDKYKAAYIVRAVTAGDFVMPGVRVEDMYRPGDIAITESSRITITADPTL